MLKVGVVVDSSAAGSASHLLHMDSLTAGLVAGVAFDDVVDFTGFRDNGKRTIIVKVKLLALFSGVSHLPE